MVFPRQRASILEARAHAEWSLTHYASRVARVRQAPKQREPDIQKAVSAAALRLRASRARLVFTAGPPCLQNGRVNQRTKPPGRRSAFVGPRVLTVVSTTGRRPRDRSTRRPCACAPGLLSGPDRQKGHARLDVAAWEEMLELWRSGFAPYTRKLRVTNEVGPRVVSLSSADDDPDTDQVWM